MKYILFFSLYFYLYIYVCFMYLILYLNKVIKYFMFCVFLEVEYIIYLMRYFEFVSE